MSPRLPLVPGVTPAVTPRSTWGVTPRATRRVALGGALAVALAATACESDSSTAPGPTGPASPATSGVSTSAAPDPDQALLDAARSETADLLALTTRARRTPGAAAALAGLAHTHRAHLAALEGDTVDVAPGRLPGRPLATVRRHETAAQRRYADWALQARSGALARLLASMSASLAAHLAALEAAATPEGGDR